MSIGGNQHVLEINSGPNRESLIDAFKYAFKDGVEIPLQFAISFRKSSIYVAAKNWQVLALEHNDNSGFLFDIRGTCKACVGDSFPIMEVEFLNYEFKATYNTNTRKGTIILHE